MANPNWKAAMQEEYDSIMKNQTWDVVDHPVKRKIIGTKWVQKATYKFDGSLEKYKSRLVAQGYSQAKGFDFEDSFTPTARMTTIRVVLALAAHKQWPVFQMQNVKSAFLNGHLRKEVYVFQPLGFEVPNSEGLQTKEGIVRAKTGPRGMVPTY